MYGPWPRPALCMLSTGTIGVAVVLVKVVVQSVISVIAALILEIEETIAGVLGQ